MLNLNSVMEGDRMSQRNNYRIMLLGISMILFSIAIIIQASYLNVPGWLNSLGHLFLYIGFGVCVLGFLVANSK